ncbi:MAG TPA: protein kinase, partial [Longimicrobium sp.]|nr:protein kinase [Longimicrobium sp.]
PPLGEALTILREAARGINVGHRMGVIHRDVKPGNIFLVEEAHGERQIRVLDFGIAKAMADEDTQTALTQDGRAPLSPAYASPEQLAGEARLTPASDVFGLGAVAFQLLTGEKPFTEADRNRMAVGMEVPVPSVRARNPAVPAPVEMVVRRALAYRPEERFANAGTFADAVDAVLRDVGSTAAAAAVPAVAGPIVTDDADDDRTALAGGDERTMLATPRGPSAAVPPAAAGARAASPAIPAPRRKAEPARRGTHPLVWILLVLALGAAGLFAAQSMSADRRGSGDPLAGLPDSANVDSTAQGDTLTAEDAPRLDRAGVALMNTDLAAATDSLRLAIELAPDQVRYRDHLAYALLRQRQFAEAAQVLEEAIRVDGSYDLLYSHLADAREGLGDAPGAIRALERFISVTLDEEDRAAAQARLARLRAIVPPPAPADTIQLGPPPPPPVDTLPQEPSDTIRLP